MSAVRTLIVDDQIVIRQILRALLTKAGYNVIAEAANGQKAIELNRAHKPDLICLDITMPGLDGLEVLKTLKQDHPDATVIMVTGHCGKDEVQQAIAAGASGYIIKPFQAGKCLEYFERILKKRYEL